MDNTYFQFTTYLVNSHTDTSSEPIYSGTDYELALRKFNSADIDDIGSDYGGFIVFEKRVDKYEFVGDLENGEYEISDFPIEDYYDNEDFYILKEEGEFETIDQKDIEPINKKSDILLYSIQRHYQQVYGRIKYNEIIVSNGKDETDDDYENYGCIQLRIADHSENITNIDKFGECDYYISIVIADKDKTQGAFLSSMYERKMNEVEVRFDSTDSEEDVIYSIDEEIERGRDFIEDNAQIKLADGTNTTFDANNPDIRYKKGGRTIAQTPAPKKDRVYGSKTNKPESASTEKSGKSIRFSAKTLASIKSIIKGTGISLDTAKAVVRRGMGAYSSSHRPTISGGKPNSRVAWGLARLNAFVYKAEHGKSKSGRYSQDDDLLIASGYKISKMDDGGVVNFSSHCIDFIRKTKAIFDNGYYHDFGDFVLIAYNSGGQKDLTVYQTINLLLSNSLSEILNKSDSDCKNLIAEFYDKARRFDNHSIIHELDDKHMIVANRDRIECSTFELNNPDIRFDGGGNVDIKGKIQGKVIHKEYGIEYYDNGSLIQPTQKTKVQWEIFGFPNNIEKKEQSFETIIDEIYGNTQKEISNKFYNNLANDKYSYLGFNPNLSLIYDKSKFDDGGLIAPNGKVSNLTPEQYKLVRTPEFKAWFGDWENSPESASKVVDENGEPLVVYHGTNNDFTIFKIEKPTIGAYGQGFYFTNDKNFASNYARGENSKILSLFLKIIKVFDIYEDEFPKEYEKYSEMSNNKGLSRDFTNKLVSQGYDGVYAKNKYNENELVVFNSNQIKLADGTNTTFDGNNPDIRYAGGGSVKSDAFKKWFGNSKVVDKKGNPLIVYHGSPDLRGLKEKYIFESRFSDNQSFFFTDNYSMAKSYADPQRAFDYQNAEEGVIGLYLSLQNPLIVNAFNQIWRKFETTIDGNEIIGTRNLIKFAENKGYDGVIVENVRDYYNNNEKKTKGGNVYVAFKPTQIKLADGTNTTFDAGNPDIRYADGGEISTDLYEKWSDLVNMTASELKAFMATKDGKEAGLTKSEADELGIKSGHESAEWILKMKKTDHTQWTPKMWEWAKRQVSFISRMRGNKGGLYDDNGNKTRKHTSLLIWGHDPTKFNMGGDLYSLNVGGEIPEYPTNYKPIFWHLTKDEFCRYAENYEVDTRLDGTKARLECEQYYKYIVVKPLLDENAERNVFLLAVETGLLPYEKVKEIIESVGAWKESNRFVKEILDYDRVKNYGASIWLIPKDLYLSADYFKNNFTKKEAERQYAKSIYKYAILDDRQLHEFLDKGVVKLKDIEARLVESGIDFKPSDQVFLNKLRAYSSKAMSKNKLKGLNLLIKADDNPEGKETYEMFDARMQKLREESQRKSALFPENERKFVDKLISDTGNNVSYNKIKLEKLAKQYGIQEQNLAKELAELSISFVARVYAHDSELTLKERYDKIVKLYENQVNLSHRTSESILLQQYSTPAPIGYLAGLFCGFDKEGGNYFEPSAGNGLLTITGNSKDFIVNEIDKIRNRNLSVFNFQEVLRQDASEPFVGFEKKFDAIITNPPFGKTEATRYGNSDIKSLEQVMALRALDTMKDSGRAAIIIGGHTEYDSEGRIQAGKNRIFFVYLYRNYNVVDVINISGRYLYSRQGTSFNVRLILINGRKQIPSGFPPLIEKPMPPDETNSPTPVTDFNTLWNRVSKQF
jgi:predicted RNA methylase